jgi:hypothetical protein
MTLARAWRRRLYGGVATATLVPAVLIVALLTVVLSGGLAQFSDLGQALSGPPIPSAQGPAHARPASVSVARAVSPTLLAAIATAGRPTAVVRRAAGGGTGTASRAPAAPAPSGSAIPRPPRSSRSAPGAGPPPKPPNSPPPRHPTLIDGIVNAATAVTSQVPAPAGPLATQTLQQAGSQADQILPPGAPGTS